jgi:hypothetical protein
VDRGKEGDSYSNKGKSMKPHMLFYLFMLFEKVLK